MNKYEVIRQNILDNKYNADMMRAFPFNISEEDRNKIYTDEKEKYGKYMKLVKLKSGKFAFYFSDEILLAVPENMSLNDLKELYCCISKEVQFTDYLKETEIVIKVKQYRDNIKNIVNKIKDLIKS